MKKGSNQKKSAQKKEENNEEDKTNAQTATKTGTKDSKKSKKVKEEEKVEVVVTKKETIKYDINFIYRREKYTLKNVIENSLLSLVKRLISKKIGLEINQFKIYNSTTELKDEKMNVYEYIKNNNVIYFDIKKENNINQDIISLNTKVNLIYKVKCVSINDFVDFTNIINKFFIESCIENHYICEPTELNVYEVGFACEDHSFQFKRFMLVQKRTNEKYKDSTFEILPVDKTKVIEPKGNIEDNEENKKINNEESDKTKQNKKSPKKTGQSDYLNKGPYITYAEIKKQEEKEDKKKWLFKKGFNNI